MESIAAPPPESRQCDYCLWQLGSTRKCIAFPKGIPDNIWRGEFDHRKPYPQDGGYQFVHSDPRLRSTLKHSEFGKP
jgi:hypothetical protein